MLVPFRVIDHLLYFGVWSLPCGAVLSLLWLFSLRFGIGIFLRSPAIGWISIIATILLCTAFKLDLNRWLTRAGQNTHPLQKSLTYPASVTIRAS